MSKKKLMRMTAEISVYIVKDETDTMNFVTKSATKGQRKKFFIGDIFINGAVCLKCGEFIRSKNRHDYRECKCGNLAVDGGSWYAKRMIKGGDDSYVDVIEKFYN